MSARPIPDFPLPVISLLAFLRSLGFVTRHTIWNFVWLKLHPQSLQNKVLGYHPGNFITVAWADTVYLQCFTAHCPLPTLIRMLCQLNWISLTLYQETALLPLVSAKKTIDLTHPCLVPCNDFNLIFCNSSIVNNYQGN